MDFIIEYCREYFDEEEGVWVAETPTLFDLVWIPEDDPDCVPLGAQEEFILALAISLEQEGKLLDFSQFDVEFTENGERFRYCEFMPCLQ